MSMRGTKRATLVRDGEQPSTSTAGPSTSGTSSSKRRRTDPDDPLWQLRPVSDLKMSSIYNRSASEAPAELFRKDLISAMKLPDNEPLTSSEYWVIADPWKQDWERGVQVPVNPDSLPAPKVKIIDNPRASGQPDFKLPKDKYIHLNRDAHYSAEKHMLSSTPACAEAACSYDLDATDTCWLRLLNAERARAGAAPVTENQLEKVIEELEVRTWDKIQAIMKSEEGLGIEYDENVICDVCRSPDSEDGNEMVFCDSCNICVHQACYGITVIPDGQWLCRPCGDGVRPTCVLCPNQGGAMKCTPSGHKWAHVSCVLWIPEVSIGCAENMEPITKISSIPASRWSLMCVLCRERKGACIQCSVKSCKTAYHVTCAFKHGLEMRAIIEDENADDGVKLRSYCLKHSVNSKKEKPGSGSEEEEVKRKRRKDMTSEEKTQARAARLHEIEKEFEKHVSVKDISSHLLDVDQDAINYIYNYWKLKRRSGHNRPLLPPKSDDNDLLSHRQEQADLDKMKMFVQLRQDLERVRNLCYMVSRREKLSRSFFRLREQTFHKQMAVLSGGAEIPPEELSAIIEANHGPSIYDKLYSHPDAVNHKTDFQELLAKIAPPDSSDDKTKKDRNGMRRSKSSNPYRKHYVNGARRSNSMYSGLSSEESEAEIARSSKYRARAIGSSTDDEDKKKPSTSTSSPKKKVSPKNKAKVSPKKNDKKKKKIPQSKALVDSSSEEDSTISRSKKDKTSSKTLRQMEKEMAAGKTGQSGSDSDDLMPIRTTRSSKFPVDIYSDSSEDSTHDKPDVKKEVDKIKNEKDDIIKSEKSPSTSDPQQSLPRTKGAMKEFVPSHVDKKEPIIDEEKPAPKKRGRKPSNKDKKPPVKPMTHESDDEAKNKENKFSKPKDHPTDLIVPQRQAAKKASENMRSTSAGKKEENTVEKVPEEVKPKLKGKGKGKEIKSPPEKLTRPSDKESEKETIAYVPQRQAAKKAAAHIKNIGSKVPVPETDNNKKKDEKSETGKSSDESPNKKKADTKDSSSSSSNSSSSSYSSSSSSDDDPEPEKVGPKPAAKAREIKPAVTPTKQPSVFSPPSTRPTVDLPFLDKVSRPLSSTSASSDSESSQSDDRSGSSSPTPKRPRRRRKHKSDASNDASPRKAPDKKLKTSEREPDCGVASPPAEREEPARVTAARAATRARTRSTTAGGGLPNNADAGSRKSSRDDAGNTNKTQKESRQSSELQTAERQAYEEIVKEPSLKMEDNSPKVVSSRVPQQRRKSTVIDDDSSKTEPPKERQRRKSLFIEDDLSRLDPPRDSRQKRKSAVIDDDLSKLEPSKESRQRLKSTLTDDKSPKLESPRDRQRRKSILVEDEPPRLDTSREPRHRRKSTLIEDDASKFDPPKEARQRNKPTVIEDNSPRLETPGELRHRRKSTVMEDDAHKFETTKEARLRLNSTVVEDDSSKLETPRVPLHRRKSTVMEDGSPKIETPKEQRQRLKSTIIENDSSNLVTPKEPRHRRKSTVMEDDSLKFETPREPRHRRKSTVMEEDTPKFESPKEPRQKIKSSVIEDDSSKFDTPREPRHRRKSTVMEEDTPKFESPKEPRQKIKSSVIEDDSSKFETPREPRQRIKSTVIEDDASKFETPREPRQRRKSTVIEDDSLKFETPREPRQRRKSTVMEDDSPKFEPLREPRQRRKSTVMEDDAPKFETPREPRQRRKSIVMEDDSPKFETPREPRQRRKSTVMEDDFPKFETTREPRHIRKSSVMDDDSPRLEPSKNNVKLKPKRSSVSSDEKIVHHKVSEHHKVSDYHKISPKDSPTQPSPKKSSERRKSISSRRMSVKEPSQKDAKDQVVPTAEDVIKPIKQRRQSRYEPRENNTTRSSESPTRAITSEMSRMDIPDKKAPVCINDDYNDSEKWLPKAPSPTHVLTPIERPGGNEKYMTDDKSFDSADVCTEKSAVKMIAKIQANLNENTMIKSPRTPMDARSLAMDDDNLLRNIRKRSTMETVTQQDASHMQGVEISKSAKIPSTVYHDRPPTSPQQKDNELFPFDIIAVDDAFSHDEIMKPFSSYPEFFFKEDSKEQGAQETLNLVDRLRMQLSSKKVNENSSQDQTVDEKDLRGEEYSAFGSEQEKEDGTLSPGRENYCEPDMRSSPKHIHNSMNHIQHSIAPAEMPRRKSLMDEKEYRPIPMTSNEKWSHMPVMQDQMDHDKKYEQNAYNDDGKEQLTVSDMQSASEVGDTTSLSKQSDDSQPSAVDNSNSVIDVEHIQDSQNYENNNSMIHSDCATISSPYIGHEAKWRESKITTRRSSASSTNSEASVIQERAHMNSLDPHAGGMPEIDSYPPIPAYSCPVEPSMPLNQYATYPPNASPFLTTMSSLFGTGACSQLPLPSPSPLYAPPMTYSSGSLSLPPKPFQLCAAFTSSSQNIALTTAMIAPPTPKPSDSPSRDGMIDVTGSDKFSLQASSPSICVDDSTYETSQGRITKMSNDSNETMTSMSQQEYKSPPKVTPLKVPIKFHGKSPGKSPGISPKPSEGLKTSKRSSNKGNRGQRGRGRSKSRGQTAHTFPPAEYHLDSIQNKLVGTVYDFEEEIANDSVDLKALRERRKSVDVRDDRRSEHSLRDMSQSPRMMSPPRSPVEELGLCGGEGGVAPLLPGPVDMRTYAGGVSPAAAPYPRLPLYPPVAADIEDHDRPPPAPTPHPLAAPPPPPPPPPPLPTPQPFASYTYVPHLPKVSLSDSRNQLKVKIKGPFLDANYSTSSVTPVVPPPPAPVYEPPVVVVNSAAVAVSSVMAGSTNLRRMRKKELLRQYWTQDMNMDDPANTTIVGAVPPPAVPSPLTRAVISIPKAVTSMTSIPTREDYKIIDTPAIEKKKRKVSSGLSRELRHLKVTMNDDVDPADDVKLSTFTAHKRRARLSSKPPKEKTPMAPPVAPKLKIKIGANIVQQVHEEPSDFRPPKKRLLHKPSLEDLRRESMKYRKMVMADFEENEKTTKHKSKSEKRKKKKDKKAEKLKVINSESESTPKLIIKIKRPVSKGESSGGGGRGALVAAARAVPEPAVDPFDYDPTAPDPLAIDTPSNSEGTSGGRNVRTDKKTPIRLKLARTQGSSYVMKGAASPAPPAPLSDAAHAHADANEHSDVR